MGFMEKIVKYAKISGKALIFFIMLEFIFREISNQFLSEASLEQSLPENAVANYNVFLVRIADNPFVLFTTHTLVKQSLFSSHTSQLLQRSGKRIMSWLPEA